MGRACHISWPRESLKPFTCSGYLREGKGGIQFFYWKNWNSTLPWNTTWRRKNCCGYTTDDGTHSYLLESLLQLAYAPDSSLTTLHEKINL